MLRELVWPHTALLRQPRLGEAPKGFDAVNVSLAASKFILVMMHPVMIESVQNKPIIRPPAVGMDGGRAFDLTMNHA